MQYILNPKKFHIDFDLKGFSFWGGNIGIKDNSLDFGVIYSQKPATADAVFTQNRFPGAPVLVGKKHIRGGLQAVVVNSKNANVYTGKKGEKNAFTMCQWGGESLNIDPQMILPSSTGIIGKQLDMNKIKRGFRNLSSQLLSGRKGLELFSKAIMTSDTYPKWGAVKVGNSTLLGVAKGAGMIEPNMATMLAYFLTDAHISLPSLRRIFRRVVDHSFNAITVDGDMSTSDTAVIIANGLSGFPKNKTGMKKKMFIENFHQSLEELATYLAQLIVADGEGAHKMIELRITKSRSKGLAEVIAKSVLNSPLVKTAVYGADPNWGRLIMAIGKVDRHWDFDPKKVRIYSIFEKDGQKEKILLNKTDGDFKSKYTLEVSRKLKHHFTEKKVVLEIKLGNGKVSKTFWGSDLSVEYVKFNSDYTT